MHLRVASLLPSATDTVVALGCARWIIARSHECDDQAVAAAPVVTSSKLGDVPTLHDADESMAGTTGALRSMAAFATSPLDLLPLLSHGLAVYQVDLDALHQLRPDVILTQIQDMCPEDAHEAGPSPGSQRVARVQAALNVLWGYSPTVVHLAAARLDECWQDMSSIAAALGIPQQGTQCITTLQQQMQWVQDACRGRHKPPVVCVQWPDPWYAAGSWVPECVQAAGGRDVLGRVEHAVAFDLKQLATSGAQVLVFALCGMDLATSVRHVRGCMDMLVEHCGGLPAIKNMRVAVVDGAKVLSRPGPLLVPSMQVLAEILHHDDGLQAYGHQGVLWQFV